MTFAVTNSLGQETIGVRMEFLANNPAIRADALARLQGGADPIAVAKSLTDGNTVIDIFVEDENTFPGKLDALLGPGQGQAYQTRVNALGPRQQDTKANRDHVLDFWQKLQTANPAVAQQIRQVFVHALQATGPIQVRWGQPPVTGKTPGTAEYTAAGEVIMTVNPGGRAPTST